MPTQTQPEKASASQKSATKTKTQREVAGVSLEAVRFSFPVPHWRIKVVATGYIYESGVFCGCNPLAYIWDYVERTAKARGASWIRENMDAHL